MKSNVLLSLLALLVGLLPGVRAVGAEAVSAIEAVQSLAGVYTGHWDMYGLDSQGDVKRTVSWDDRIILTNPQISIDPNLGVQRAFGIVTNSMIYQYPAGIPSMTVEFTEGFKINSDGSAGDHYFTFKNRLGEVQETVETQVGPAEWQYESSVDLTAFASLGITNQNLISAKNKTVKNISLEGTLEIQNVSRTTSLVWRALDGSLQSKQFVSMKGVHKRTL